MSGELALCESANSLACFFKLFGLGVSFPQNEYGKILGYQTDHDDKKRATSAGLLTSKVMPEALLEKPERCAVLDVTFPEPPDEDSPRYTMENVSLTPYIAGSSGEECKRMGRYMADEAKRYLKGEPLKYEVTLKMLETMA